MFCKISDNLIQTIDSGKRFLFFRGDFESRNLSSLLFHFEDKTDGSLTTRYAEKHSPRMGVEAVKILLENQVKLFLSKISVQNVPNCWLFPKPENQRPAEIVLRHLRLLILKAQTPDRLTAGY